MKYLLIIAVLIGAYFLNPFLQRGTALTPRRQGGYPT